VGLWGWIKRNLGDGPPSSSTTRRGPTRTGDDRVKRAQATYIAYLKKHDIERYKAAMDAQIGLGGNRNDPIEQLKTLMALQALAKKSGLLKDGDGGDSLDRFVDKLPEIMSAVGPMAVQLANGRRPPPPIEHQSPAARPAELSPPRQPARKRLTRVAPEPEDELDEEAFVDEESSSSDRALIFDDTPATMAAEGADPMPFPISPAAAAEIAVAILQSKADPREAAEWILSQSSIAAVHGMIEVIRKTPDKQLFDVLDLHARAEPDFQPLMTYFRSRGSWSLDVARHLRSAIPASQAGGAHPAGARAPTTRRGPRPMKAL